MKTVPVPVPEAILSLLASTPLAGRPTEEQVRIALALYLFEREEISFGKAAELTAEPRATMQLLAAKLGIAVVRYDEDDYQRDIETIERAWGRT